ncbi:hypothetical protein QFZ30_003127 [Arthrobacter pascens]|nr:hypothetical protein [Arthrobacter pascens]
MSPIVIGGFKPAAGSAADAEADVGGLRRKA